MVYLIYNLVNWSYWILLKQWYVTTWSPEVVRYNLITRGGFVYIWKIGMSAVSLDTPEKEREFGGLLTRYTALWIKIWCSSGGLRMCRKKCWKRPQPSGRASPTSGPVAGWTMALVGKLSSFVSTLDGQIVHHTINNYLPHHAMLELLSAVLLGPVEEQQPGTHGVLGRFPAVRRWPSITRFCYLLNNNGMWI